MLTFITKFNLKGENFNVFLDETQATYARIYETSFNPWHSIKQLWLLSTALFSKEAQRITTQNEGKNVNFLRDTFPYE